MKAAIYCRLSEEDRNKQFETDDSNSIQNQKAMLLQYAMEQGWEVYNLYSDDDYTGSDRRRPEFNRLLEDAKAHRFDIVLCKTQSRFTRELELVEKYIHGLFPIWGIRFVSIVDNADTANKGNKKSRQINGLVNEWYLEDMSENIRSVLTNRRQNGFHIGAFALYGYQKDPDQKGHLIIDEEAAAVVREVFTLFSQGYGKTAIARMLNDRGIPNPTEYKRLHGLRYQQPKRKNSTLWKYFAISDMLTNEIYIGNMVQGKYGSVSYKTKQNKPRPQNEWFRVEGTHEPVISMELWNKVQQMMQDHSKPMCTGQIGLFAGKTRCMYCGYTMASCKNREYRYLKCSSRHFSNDSCKGAFIAQRFLEQAVLNELNQIIKKYFDAPAAEERLTFSQNSQSTKKAMQRELDSSRNRLDDLKKAVRNMYIDKVKGIISEAEYMDFKNSFQKEMLTCQNRIHELEEQRNFLDQQVQSQHSKTDILKAYANVQKLDRDIMDQLVDYIEVGRLEKKQHRNDLPPIIIHWKF